MRIEEKHLGGKEKTRSVENVLGEPTASYRPLPLPPQHSNTPLPSPATHPRKQFSPSGGVSDERCVVLANSGGGRVSDGGRGRRRRGVLRGLLVWPAKAKTIGVVGLRCARRANRSKRLGLPEYPGNRRVLPARGPCKYSETFGTLCGKNVLDLLGSNSVEASQGSTGHDRENMMIWGSSIQTSPPPDPIFHFSCSTSNVPVQQTVPCY
ncbi:hypothetical protein BDK51DRAFT_46302 [Blyttiomyces helicus]|uniref:Uncharacterized protein n=1 Tax=Blyttiomyces helicus TaxID=388810 RepID=A0A4P9W8M6_9FUNG|nr:hypothetical protein BDK51DRAFT_46302 [Blyttiomyces helicus]|eukprot:RKO87150.1 hypothetical protein BDK51DRAFT_46302 [Blyttiomyces helicus]